MVVTDDSLTKSTVSWIYCLFLVCSLRTMFSQSLQLRTRFSPDEQVWLGNGGTAITLYMKNAENASDLQRTAVVLTVKEVIDDCHILAVRHMVESTPGMDVWVLSSHHLLTETARNESLSNIKSIPGLFHMHQMENQTERQKSSKFNTDYSGTSKLSFLKFLVENENYDFAWHLESDIFYSGPWIEFFQDEARDNSTDYLSAIIPRPWKNWIHHKKNCIVYGERCNRTRQVAWQAARVSTRMARALLDGINDGHIIGHHEAVVHPLAVEKNFTLRQIDQLKVAVMGFGTKNIESLERVKNLEAGMLVHPLKCQRYANMSKFSSDFQKYAMRRPVESQQEIWDSRKSLAGRTLIPVYSIQSLIDNGTNLPMPTREAFQALGPMQPTTLTEIKQPSPDTVSEWVKNGTLQFWNTTATNTSTNAGIPTIPSLDQLSKILSLCLAILRAFQDGHEQVLIMEDGTFLPRVSAASLPDELSFGSRAKNHPNWEIVGLRSTNPEHLYPVGPKGWTQWTNNTEHHVQAFVIRRRGMESILSKIHSIDGKSGNSVWHLPPISDPLFSLVIPNCYVTKSPLIPDSNILKSAWGLGYHGSNFVGMSPDFL